MSRWNRATNYLLPDPQDLATEAITELEAIVGDLREIVALIEREEEVEI
jgi:hypothetical protein